MLILSVILLQIFIFTGLVFFLRKILNRNVISATKHLEELAAEYVKKEQQIKKQLDDTQRQCQEIITNADKDTQKKREESLAKVKAEKDKILNDAQQKADEVIEQAERARQALIAEIEKKIKDKAINQAAELLKQALPEHIREEIHHRWLDELISGSFQQLDRLHVPEGEPEVKVRSAFALTPKQRDALNAKIKEKLGTQVHFKEEVDASVISGLIIDIGGLVLDGSLRFKIREVASAQE